jgi:predicted CopG family antitoxin
MSFKQVNLPYEVYERLLKLQKPRQSIGGIIEELLNEVDKIHGASIVTDRPTKDNKYLD